MTNLSRRCDDVTGMFSACDKTVWDNVSLMCSACDKSVWDYMTRAVMFLACGGGVCDLFSL